MGSRGNLYLPVNESNDCLICVVLPAYKLYLSSQDQEKRRVKLIYICYLYDLCSMTVKKAGLSDPVLESVANCLSRSLCEVKVCI